MPSHSLAHALCLAFSLLGLGACDGEGDGDEVQASGEEQSTETETGPDLSEPMGESPELGGACAQTPVATLGEPASPGQIMPNVVGLDQYGESVDLYEDLCDRYVLIVRAGFDCGSCNTNAPTHQELYAEYREQGLVVITLLHDYTQDIGIDEQNVWANQYGLEHPVLADNDQLVSEPLWPNKLGRPMHRLVGPGAERLHADPTHADVIALF